MPEARQNSSKLPDIFESASSFSALVGTTVDVVSLFMALLSFVESAPRAYRLKASNAASPISTSIGTIPIAPSGSGASLSRNRRSEILGAGHQRRQETGIAQDCVVANSFPESGAISGWRTSTSALRNQLCPLRPAAALNPRHGAILRAAARDFPSRLC